MIVLNHYRKELTMSTTDNATCEQRIANYMGSREADLAILFKIEQEGSGSHEGEIIDASDASDLIYEIPLGVSTHTVVRIDLSTGGPADWLEAKCVPGRHGLEIDSVTYHFSDWFDHAERSVEEGSPLWDLAERFVDLQDIVRA